jgi:hypothetical protein
VACCSTLSWHAAHRHRLLGEHITPAQARRITLSFLPGPVAYGLAASVGLAVPALGLVLYVVLLIAYLMEFRSERRRSFCFSR